MTEGIHTIVVDSTGARGALLNRGADSDYVIIDLGEGDRRRVPRTSLRPQPDLTIKVEGQLTDYDPIPVHPVHLAIPEAEVAVPTPVEDNAVIPVLKEEIRVDTERVETGGVRIHKTVHETEHLVQTPTVVEEVDVERVAIGRIVSEAPAIRMEGDVTILSVVEEILVVEKRLLLKEEIRITKTRRSIPNEDRITLRHEGIEIERFSLSDPETPA
ncbi:MAG: YsnF/AvaK domain-containing protein [Fimbriimonas sp.]